MELGVFSISLAVKDLAASQTFYETLGFTEMNGDAEMGYLIMKNGTTIIGLFQGMFENNMITFNPGWDANAEAVDPFDDVRAIQAALVAAGYEPQLPIDADSGSEGPAHFSITDPDGNTILFDQHR